MSSPPFDTLNLGGKWGDDAGSGRRKSETVPARRRGRRAALRRAPGSRRARRAGGRAATTPEAVPRLEADGLCTDRAGTWPLGRVRRRLRPGAPRRSGERGRSPPCTPAGAAPWRASLPAAVRALAELGARPGRSAVALGPAIGPCCFEVGARGGRPRSSPPGQRRRRPAVAARSARPLARRSRGRPHGGSSAGGRRSGRRGDRRAAARAASARASTLFGATEARPGR